MNLILIAVFAAVCSGDKLDRTYLPPSSAKSSGGSPGSLQAPFAGNSFNQGLGGLPKGSFTNDFQGVVVDAASPGTRATEGETGLGAPRISYGSTNSKVGDAAFRGVAGFKQVNPQFNQNSDSDVQAASLATGFSQAQVDNKAERSQAPYDRVASTLRLENVVDTDSYHYAFETDNGISAEENGVAVNGVQSQGGYSYTGDDGQVYSVTYTADEGGYQPKGDHLPTPPPIPEEILKSLEQNARDEAAGLVDDGSYDAQKYNAGGDYAETDVTRQEQYDRPTANFVRRPESDATASSTFIDQNKELFARPNLNLIQDNSQKLLSNSLRPTNTANTQPYQMNQLQQQNGLENQNKFGTTGVGIVNNNRQTLRPTGSSSEQFVGVNNGNTYPTEDVSGSSQGSRFPEYQSSQSFEMPSSNKFNTDSFHQKPSFGVVQNTEISQPTLSNFGSRKEYLPPSTSQNVHSQKPAIPSQATQATTRFHSTSHSRNPPQTDFINTNTEQSQQTYNNYQQKPQSPSQKYQHANIQGTENVNRFPQKTEKTEDIGSFMTSLSPQRPTSVPSLELTTPFESNEQPSVQGFQSNNKAPSSFSSSQISNIRPMMQFGIQSNKQPSSRPQASVPQQIDSGSVYKQPQSAQNTFNQYQPDDAQFSPSTVRPTFNEQGSDNSYYYKQPAKPFNFPTTPESRFPSATAGEFNRVNQRPVSSQFPSVPQNTAFSNSYQAQRDQNRGSTRYPEPPTLAPTVPTSSGQLLASTSASQFNGITQASVSPFRPQNQGSTKYPRPPTVAPTAPTSAHGSSQKYNGVTQATASSFVSSSPTVSANFISQSPFPSRPSFLMSQSQFQTPSSQSHFHSAQSQDSPSNKDQGQSPNSVPTQQYSGQIYEYSKPSENIPAPHKTESTSGLKQGQTVSAYGFNKNEQPQQPTRPSFGERPQSGSQPPRYQFNIQDQPGNSLNKNEQHQQPTRPSFGERPLSGSLPSRNQFSAQDQPGQDSTPQYNVQSRPFGSPQAPQVSGSQTSTQNNNRPNCCQSLNSKISQLESQKPSIQGATFTQFPGSSSQTSSFAGRGEAFSGHRKPPSFDQETGYHY